MGTIGILPAGVRLDEWPGVTLPEAPQDDPEVAGLREELRRSMPYLASQLEILAKVRQLRDLAGRVAGPAPPKLTTRKS